MTWHTVAYRKYPEVRVGLHAFANISPHDAVERYALTTSIARTIIVKPMGEKVFAVTYRIHTYGIDIIPVMESVKKESSK
jgi:hypothetical protein